MVKITSTRSKYVVLLGDTLSFRSDSVYAGQQAVMSVDLVNSQELERVVIPFTYGDSLLLSLDSVTLGTRTDYFEGFRFLNEDPVGKRFTVELIADNGGGSFPLPAGSGEVMRLFFTTYQYALGGRADNVDSTDGTRTVLLSSDLLTYEPAVYSGMITMRSVLRGDANGSGTVNIADVTYLVAYLFTGGPAPVSIQAGDAAVDFQVTIPDLTYLVDYLFTGGPPPPSP